MNRVPHNFLAIETLAGVAEGPALRLSEDDIGRTFRLLRTLGVSEADADDATQEVLIIAHASRQRIIPGKERSFLFGIALRIAKRYRNVRRSDELDESVVPASAPTMEDALDQLRARELVERLLSDLSMDLRSVFVLVEIEGMTAPEVAELLSLPLGTVTSRLRRARETFAAKLTRAQRRAENGRR